jgi:signal transduction histidine kinase
MKKIIKGFIFGLFALSLTTGAFAAEKGTKEEAQALVKAIVAFHKANGKEKAIAEGNNPTGQFRVKDLYIFAYDSKGINLVHSNPKMHGKDLLQMKDAKGVPLIQEMIKAGDSGGGNGWINYDWPNGVTKVVEPKTSYVEKFDGVYYACGYYR